MRQARSWFFTFNPKSAEDFMDVMLSDKSGYYRMVVSYWDMAASLVNNGAIDEKMFNEANGEHIFVFSKVEPFLADIRSTNDLPEYLKNLEDLVMRQPNIQERLAAMRERIGRMMAIREERAKAQAQAATQ